MRKQSDIKIDQICDEVRKLLEAIQKPKKVNCVAMEKCQINLEQ